MLGFKFKEIFRKAYGSKYSRMDQVRFVEDRSDRQESIWVEVFKNGPSEVCGRQSLKKLIWSILEYLDPYEME